MIGIHVNNPPSDIWYTLNDMLILILTFWYKRYMYRFKGYGCGWSWLVTITPCRLFDDKSSLEPTPRMSNTLGTDWGTRNKFQINLNPNTKLWFQANACEYVTGVQNGPAEKEIFHIYAVLTLSTHVCVGQSNKKGILTNVEVVYASWVSFLAPSANGYVSRVV